MNGNKTLWIARNENDKLYLYREKPIKDTKWGVFKSCDFQGWSMPYLYDDFPEVTWENSPIEVELKLKMKEG